MLGKYEEATMSLKENLKQIEDEIKERNPFYRAIIDIRLEAIELGISSIIDMCNNVLQEEDADLPRWRV